MALYVADASTEVADLFALLKEWRDAWHESPHDFALTIIGPDREVAEAVVGVAGVQRLGRAQRALLDFLNAPAVVGL